MGSPKWLYLVILMYYYLLFSFPGDAIESPQYTVVHSESDFEIRLYLQSFWMSAQLPRGTTSFEKSTKDGFHRLINFY